MASGSKRRGVAWQWWVVIGVFAVAIVVGIVVQSSRSKSENSAAAAAVCAGDAKKFFQYSDILYTKQQAENSGYLTQARLVQLGEDAGIKGAALNTFKACVKSKKYEGFVRRSADDASKRGVNQTPTVFATGPNGKAVELTGVQTETPAQFKQAIADIAANKSS